MSTTHRRTRTFFKNIPFQSPGSTFRSYGNCSKRKDDRNKKMWTTFFSNTCLVAEGLRENLAGGGFPVFGSRERDVSKSAFGTDTRKRAGGGRRGGQMVISTLRSDQQKIRGSWALWAAPDWTDCNRKMTIGRHASSQEAGRCSARQR